MILAERRVLKEPSDIAGKVQTEKWLGDSERDFD
jgi:hypothetical protein